MTSPSDEQHSLSMRLTVAIQAMLFLGLAIFLYLRNWENVFLTTLVIALTLIPAFLKKHHRIIIPPDFQLISALFVFLSLFLGSAIDLYYKIWWWDMLLHTGSGFLFGIVGFLAIFLLNQTDHIPKSMKPAFVCFFAVTFGVFVGVIWEIIEFAIDLLWPGVNMQSAETGVHDTMHDLIVDTLGAIIVAAMGYVYTKTGRYSFIADSVQAFVKRNPRFFRKSEQT